MLSSVLVAVQPHIVELVSIGVAIVVTNASTYAKRKWKIDVEARHREALQSALTNGALLALSNKKAGADAVEAVLDYALDSVPDAVKYFKVSNEKLRKMAQAKLIRGTK